MKEETFPTWATTALYLRDRLGQAIELTGSEGWKLLTWLEEQRAALAHRVEIYTKKITHRDRIERINYERLRPGEIEADVLYPNNGSPDFGVAERDRLRAWPSAVYLHPHQFKAVQAERIAQQNKEIHQRYRELVAQGKSIHTNYPEVTSRDCQLSQMGRCIRVHPIQV